MPLKIEKLCKNISVTQILYEYRNFVTATLASNIHYYYYLKYLCVLTVTKMMTGL